jgi:hypothetical protein
MPALAILVDLGTAFVPVSPDAPTLTGRWQGATPNGVPLELNLTVTDKALTGTVIRDGQTIDITDGTVSGNSFTFKAKLGEEAERLSGELDGGGDQIRVWLERQGPSAAVVLKRVKPERSSR